MRVSLSILIVLIGYLSPFFVVADTLYTVDGTKYDGKLVAFKYGLIHFNIYKFNKYRSLKKFPLGQVWKIEFNSPKKVGLTSSFETESIYAKLRRGKRLKKITLSSETKWIDTGVLVKTGQDIFFSVSGAIYINPSTKVFQNGELNVTWNTRKQLPVQPTGAVIAKIGKKGKPFYVGNNKTPFRITSKGKLFIGINDFNFKDNSGNFDVKIFY